MSDDFAEVLASQIPRLRRYARALTHDVEWADDLVQDTLERALRHRWRFRFGSNLTAWLFTILYRRYLSDALRPRPSALTEVSESEFHEPAAAGDAAARLDIQRALGMLSAEQRAVVVLIGLEQLSYKEAAEVLNIPPGTVMSRLARAREHLRTLLSDTSGSSRPASQSAALTRIK